MKLRHFLLCSLSLLFFSCLKAPKTAKSCAIVNNTEDFFTIQDNTDSPGRAYNVFCKKVNVFGVYVYGTCKVEDSDLLRAANVLAQYLDNDEDGLVDNPLVLQKMIENKAAMAMFGKENSSFKRRFFRTNEGDYTPESAQDLYGEETHPNWDNNSPFDAAFEEVLHLVTTKGYSLVYPDVFGEFKGSLIANAMDIARGGSFDEIPSQYPSSAWYTYDDQTCEYGCQVSEYFYWALTSLLGAQDYPGRIDEIGNEWKLNTPELLQNNDTSVYSILTNPIYALPTTLPDGSYRK